jgi:signal transduction histidine kinase
MNHLFGDRIMEVSGGGKVEKEKNPRSYFYLSVLRIGFFIILSYVYFCSDEGSGVWMKAYIITTLVVLAVNGVLYLFVLNRKALLALALVDIVAATPYGYVFLGGSDPDLLFLGLVGFFVFVHLDYRSLTMAWIVYLPAIIFSQIFLEYKLIGRVEITMYIVSSAFVVFSTLIGSLIRYYRQSRIRIAKLYSDLEHSHKQLRAYAQNAEEMAVNRERIRIAREIHDTVGHAMTTLLVQLQAVRKLQEIDITKSREHFLHCEELARSALREVRLSVRAMRDEKNRLPLKQSLDKLIRDFAASTGLAITFETDSDYPVLPETLQTTLLRTIQESLTNVQKHSRASETSVILRFMEHRIVLSIRDNGSEQTQIVPGFGLLNMRERIEEHGGTARWDSRGDSGFVVEVTLPLVQPIHAEGEAG